MHAKLAFKHLYLPLHEALHPHRMSWWQDSFVCGRAVQNGDHALLSRCHPQSDGLRSTGWKRRASNVASLEHHSFDVLFKWGYSGRDAVKVLRPLWKVLLSRFVYFRKAALRSYVRTTNFSSTAMHSPVISCGNALRTFSTGVSWGNTFHTSRAVFFPHPPKKNSITPSWRMEHW